MAPILHIPKVSLKALSEKELDIYQNLDQRPYGRETAMRVVEKLLLGIGLFHAHRDYCGMGIFFFENSYTLGVVYDGYDAPFNSVVTSSNKDDFASWLSRENDQSMSLYGEKFNNQTITLVRLEWYLDEDYSPVWNDYCFYLRRRNLI